MAPQHASRRTAPPPLRPSTPTRQLRGQADIASPSATPTTPKMRVETGDIIMGGQGVLVPPSPAFSRGPFDQEPQVPQSPQSPFFATRRAKTTLVLQDRTGAGVKKAKASNKMTFVKLVDATAGTTSPLSDEAIQKPFRFMDLPGELRNMIYDCTFEQPKQALLVHRPRMASLRPRTRLDRQRTLDSDIKDRELGYQLSLASDKSRRVNKEANSSKKRETNRPFWGLTQVSSQIRREFRPIYLHKQEIGMDLTEVVAYIQTFYFNAHTEVAKLDMRGGRTKDMPFNGNLTIAVGDKPNDVEKSKGGIEIIPLLDLWANSFKIEAGFGRYLKNNYVPQTDGEAKDLYRLFGRRVLKNRQCSSMNPTWRSLLRSRAIASLTLHRRPASRTVDTATVPLGDLPTALLVAQQPLPARITIEPKPFIHILFRAECAEPWMTDFVSGIPKHWLALRGFANMEHFHVKVGVAPPGFDRRIGAAFMTW